MKTGHSSVHRVLKKERNAIEVIACTLFSTCLFVYVYAILESKLRHDSPALAYILGPGIALLICLGITGMAVKKKMEPEQRLIAHQRDHPKQEPAFTVHVNRNRNLFMNLALVSWAALVLGFLLGERSYWIYTLKNYSYGDLVSYVDIDPALDRGTSYMDAGHIYFKEHSNPLVQGKFGKFRNGDTYCAAPIIRGPFLAFPNTQSVANVDETGNPKVSNGYVTKSKVVNGYVIPESGTFDFWAVGTNCCEGKVFKCGEVDNPLARAGMRLLSDNQRPFYLLAVQAWSATYGLPVKHPLFFEWVKDPVEYEEDLSSKDQGTRWRNTLLFALGAFIVSFLIHLALHKVGIY